MDVPEGEGHHAQDGEGTPERGSPPPREAQLAAVPLPLKISRTAPLQVPSLLCADTQNSQCLMLSLSGEQQE